MTLTYLKKNFNYRYKSFEKAFSLAIDINDADLFMILFKCAKAHGQDEMAEESMKKADEIYAKEEDESHRKFPHFFPKFKFNRSSLQTRHVLSHRARFVQTRPTLKVMLISVIGRAKRKNLLCNRHRLIPMSLEKNTTEARLGDSRRVCLLIFSIIRHCRDFRDTM